VRGAPDYNLDYIEHLGFGKKEIIMEVAESTPIDLVPVEEEPTAIQANTDHFFRMGSLHKICEDYAASSSDPQYSDSAIFALLSDGCSLCRDGDGNTIPAHTDYGSRLLVRAAYDVLKQQPADLKYFHNLTLEKASIFCRALGFPRYTLSATLLTAQIVDGQFVITVCGDGVVAARDRKTKRWRVSEFSFTPPPPYYLRYELYPGDREEFLKDFQYFAHTVYLLDTKTGEIGESGVGYQESPHITDNHRPSPYFAVRNYDLKFYDTVVIMSDGIQTFKRKNGGNPISIPTEEILRCFLAINTACIHALKAPGIVSKW